MNLHKKLTYILLILALFVVKPVSAQTEEPTPDVTPVVIESAPVEIPEDSTVIVVEAPEPEPAPTTTTFDSGLLVAGVTLVALAILAVFGVAIVTAGKGAPPWLVEMIIGGGDAVKPSIDTYVKGTPTPLDDAAAAELWKAIDKIKADIRTNAANIEKTQGGL
jgi:hypothetical protein